MSKDLRILITAGLDGIGSQREIQKNLDAISKNLELNVGIDTENIGKIQKQIDSLKSQLSKNGQGVKIIDDKDAIASINQGKKGIRELYTDIDKAVDRYRQFGRVKLDKTFDPLTRQLNGFNMSIDRGSGLVDKLRLDLVKLGDVTGKDGFEVVSRKQLDDTQRATEKQLQTVKKAGEERVRQEQRESAQREKNLQYEQRVRQAIANKQQREREKSLQYEQKTRSAIERKTQQEKQKTQELQRQLQLYKQQAQLNAQNLRRTHGTSVDSKELSNYLKNVRELSTSTPNLQSRMRSLGMEFKQVSANAKELSGATAQAGMGMGEMLRTAMVKFAV